MRHFESGLAIAAALVALCATGAAADTGVTACGTVIGAPGQYVLANDLLACAGTGVTINASTVVLRLDGHTIQGVGGGSGIQVASGQTNVRLLGDGLISGFQFGILFENVDDSSVKDVRVVGNQFGIAVNAGPPADNFSERNQFLRNLLENGGHGFTVNGGSNSRFANNVACNNSGRGIYLFRGTGNEVVGNTTNGNAEIGISVEGPLSTGHLIHENSAFGNGVVDLADGNPDCDNNTWTNNQFATAFPASCIGMSAVPTLPGWALLGAVLAMLLCGLLTLKQRTVASHSRT